MKKLFGIFLYALAVLGILVFPSQIDKTAAARLKREPPRLQDRQCMKVSR